MTEIKVGVVDLYVIHVSPAGAWRVLLLLRADGARCAGAWETVHGRVEPGETPVEAALRELKEETGLTPARLYNVTVQPFYLHRSDTIQAAVVFAAFVENDAVTLGDEHAAHAWLDVPAAMERFAWPRERESLRDIVSLLSAGDAGPLEDVLRVR